MVHPLYAVVRSGGKQYRVEEGLLLTVASLEGEPGKKVTFGEVLLVADGDVVKAAAKATVTGEIVGHGKTEKLALIQRYLQDEIKDAPAFGNLAALRARTPGDVVRFQQQFDTFVGAGMFNPTLTFDVAPIPP